MNYSEFRKLAEHSAELYYNYLTQNEKGTSLTKVSRVTRIGKEVFLHLQGRLSPAALDTIQIQIYADRYPSDVMQPIEYQSDTGVLTLRPKKEMLPLFPSGPCEHIFAVSDLRFLVERVGKWYHFNQRPLSLPSTAPSVRLPDLGEMAGGSPSQEQYDAVCGILTTPFSYVWGAPGTGKTRFVLANCVLSYLLEDKKVLLVAPTNNALEQMLSGILEVLIPAGIPSDRIRRLGVPSGTFSENYPKVCERRSTEQERTRLTAQAASLRKKIQQLSAIQAIQADCNTLTTLSQDLAAAQDLRREKLVPEKTIQLSRTAAEEHKRTAAYLSLQIQELSIWRDSFPGRLCKFFIPSKYSSKLSALVQCQQDQEEALRISSIEEQRYLEFQQINSQALESFDDSFQSLLVRFSDLCSASTLHELTQLLPVRPKHFSRALEQAVSIASSSLDKCRQSAAEASTLPDADLDHLTLRLTDAEHRLALLDEIVEAHWSNVRVLAMTIDRYIASNFAVDYPDFTPEHIFMDEAAYCSLVKGYTLLALNRPLTLLGDHAQLPPVCEMSDAQFKKGAYRPVFLWAQSAIHLESSFLLSSDELYQCYADGQPPQFSMLQLHQLPLTYRFGPNLAHVLSSFIYTGTFKSALTEETTVKYIYAPSSPSDEKRTSRAECAAITALARELYAESVDFAILTPYKKQLSLLSKSMRPLASAGRIMTVHAAQGREFHTVILSAVDTSDKFYVNSSIPSGRSVLNTAISRTKSELILVLDSDYWSTQENQLIGQLLKTARPYTNRFYN